MAPIPSQPATAGTEHTQRVLDPKAKARLQRAVKEFESVMVGYMLKSMRASMPKDDMFGDSYGGDMLEGMFDGGIGTVCLAWQQSGPGRDALQRDHG